jgi:hypothetical protein
LLDGQGEELALMTKIVAKMAKDLDLRAYHDGYKERMEPRSWRGAQVKEEKLKKPAANA